MWLPGTDWSQDSPLSRGERGNIISDWQQYSAVMRQYWCYSINSALLIVSGPTLYRLLYIGNLPADITESTLREHFPEALQVILPCNEETSERLG